MIQTLASRLIHIQEAKASNVVLKTTLIETSKQRQPAVIFDIYDYMHTLTVNCKYTIFGKFSTTMPNVDLIKKSFIQQTPLSGDINIAHYNAKHVFIDLKNELDYNTLYTQ